MKTILIILVLAGLIWFNWDKVPEPIRDASKKVYEIGSALVSEGKNPPEPIKKFLEAKADRLKKEFKK